jgi:pyruvate/2-oxoglutarate dehydrogenase complex dihydrolipoamide dehydrogenase (E3) component
VGLTSKEVDARGEEVKTITVDLDEVDRAIVDGTTGGFVRIHVTGRSGRIAGATIVAPGAGEIISSMSIAMAEGVALKDLINVIYPYPTLSEAVRVAAMEHQRSRLKPALKKTLSGYFFLRRKRS